MKRKKNHTQILLLIGWLRNKPFATRFQVWPYTLGSRNTAKIRKEKSHNSMGELYKKKAVKKSRLTLLKNPTCSNLLFDCMFVGQFFRGEEKNNKQANKTILRSYSVQPVVLLQSTTALRSV